MLTSSWLLILVAIILIVLGIIYYISNKNNKRPTDFYTMFIMGLIWLPIGLALKNYTLFIIGIVSSCIGLVNKDKWEQNRRRWKDLTYSEKRFKMVTIVILVIILILGAIFYLLT